MSVLPRISQLVYPIELKSINLTTSFRPFTVAEEKILLMVRDSKDTAFIAANLIQLVKNCITDNIDVGKLAMYDVEMFLVKVRSKSVNEIITITYTDPETKIKTKVEINLEEVYLDAPERSNKIEITDEVGLILRDPSFNSVLRLQTADDTSDGSLLWEMVLDGVEKVYTKDSVFTVGVDFTREELDEFLEQIPTKSSAKIYEFFDKMPKVKVDFVLPDGTKQSIEGIKDFLVF